MGQAGQGRGGTHPHQPLSDREARGRESEREGERERESETERMSVTDIGYGGRGLTPPPSNPRARGGGYGERQ